MFILTIFEDKNKWLRLLCAPDACIVSEKKKKTEQKARPSLIVCPYIRSPHGARIEPLDLNLEHIELHTFRKEKIHIKYFQDW